MTAVEGGRLNIDDAVHGLLPGPTTILAHCSLHTAYCPLHFMPHQASHPPHPAALSS